MADSAAKCKEEQAINGKAQDVFGSIHEQQMTTFAEMMQQFINQAMEGSKVVSIRRIKDPKTGRLAGAVQIRADGTEIPIQIQ